MIGGYIGKCLDIDLSKSKIEEITFDEQTLRKYIGGSGLGTKILYERTDKNTGPLSEENVLIYMTGPLVDTMVPTSGRHQIITKSPLTNIFTESDAGGTWGINLKKAGYDGIIISGKHEKPVYLYINDGRCEILDAEYIWGLDVFATDDKLKEIHGKKTVVSCIGTAGENLSPISCVNHDGRDARVCGRTGIGAVLGSKNLKAIAVNGNGRIRYNDKNSLIENLKLRIPEIRKKTIGMNKYGTAGGIVSSEATGDIPIKNWSQGNWNKIELISGQKIEKEMLKKSYHCGSCPIGCGRDLEFKDKYDKQFKGAGPEYETIALIGSNCLIDDLEEIVKINEMCNDFGIDTISFGSIIGFVMELNEKGYISQEKLENIDLNWGNYQATKEILVKIAENSGVGKFLGRGVKKISEDIGNKSYEYAVHVKGLELPGHDPRAYNSMALGYATSNRGACHLQGASYFFEKSVTLPSIGLKEPQDRLSDNNKAELNYLTQNVMSMMDSLKICKFLLYGGADIKDFIYWIKCVVGWDMTIEEFMKTGERIFNLKRLYNTNYCEVSNEDDIIPKRIKMEPRYDKGTGENLPNIDKMLKEYYKIRMWDDNGRPLKKLLDILKL